MIHIVATYCCYLVLWSKLIASFLWAFNEVVRGISQLGLDICICRLAKLWEFCMRIIYVYIWVRDNHKAIASTEAFCIHLLLCIYNSLLLSKSSSLLLSCDSLVMCSVPVIYFCLVTFVCEKSHVNLLSHKTEIHSGDFSMYTRHKGPLRWMALFSKQ